MKEGCQVIGLGEGTRLRRSWESGGRRCGRWGSVAHNLFRKGVAEKRGPGLCGSIGACGLRDGLLQAGR